MRQWRRERNCNTTNPVSAWFMRTRGSFAVSKKNACSHEEQAFSCVFLALQTETLVELGNASAGIDKLLLAGEERVTLRADFHANILLRRTCLNHITAGAFDSSLLIIGMDSFLHCSGSPLSGTLVVWAFTHKRNCDNTTACGKLQALFYNFTVEFVWKKYRSFSDTSFSSTLPSASA
jgi:hypothetical protein